MFLAYYCFVLPIGYTMENILRNTRHVLEMPPCQYPRYQTKKGLHSAAHPRISTNSVILSRKGVREKERERIFKGRARSFHELAWLVAWSRWNSPKQTDRASEEECGGLAWRCINNDGRTALYITWLEVQRPRSRPRPRLLSANNVLFPRGI